MAVSPLFKRLGHTHETCVPPVASARVLRKAESSGTIAQCDWVSGSSMSSSKGPFKVENIIACTSGRWQHPTLASTKATAHDLRGHDVLVQKNHCLEATMTQLF